MNPMIVTKLRELLGFAEKHGLNEIAWQNDGVKIAFRRSLGTATPLLEMEPISEAKEAEEAAPEEFLVKAPMVGLFRRGQTKGRPPLVMEGNHIKPGDRVAIVECMKIPTDVISFSGGEIKKILVEDGTPVEYGQPLFVVVQKN